MADEERKMTSRLPVAPDTHSRLQDFARAIDATFDGAINFLLHKVINDVDDEQVMAVSRQFRAEYKELTKPIKGAKKK